MPPEPKPILLRFLPAVIVFTAAVAPYLGVLEAPFVFDDVKLVAENRFLREAHDDPSRILATFDILDRRWDEEELRPNYRPLRFLSYLGDYALSRWWFGDFPDGSPPVLFFRLTNVLLHALNALLVLAIARQLARRLLSPGEEAGPFGPDGFLALAAAILFAVHPLHTEAVTYISGRRDVLSAFFVLAAAALHLRGDPAAAPRPAAAAGTLLLLAAGLLSKESAAVLPGILLLIDLALRARWSPGRVLFHALSWGLVIAYAAIILSNPRLIAPAGDRDLAGAILTACRYAARYLGLAVLPLSQSADYSYDAIPESTGPWSPWTTLPALVLLLALAAAGILLAARRDPAPRIPGIGLLWFLGALAPVLQIVPVAEKFAERFAYLPLAGLVLIPGFLLERARRREPIIGWGLAGILAVAGLGASAARNDDWRSPLDLWTSAVEAQPRAARAHLGRAIALREAGRLGEAAEECTAALRIFEERPAVPLHHGFIIQALVLRGQVHGILGAEDPALLDRAVDDYRRVLAATDVDGKVIESAPEHANLHFDLAGFLLQGRRLDEARAEYRRVIDLGAPPLLASRAEYFLGKASLIEGDIPGAIEAMESALGKLPASDPSRARVAIEISELYLERKELDRASEVLRRALEGAQGADRLHLLFREAKVLDRRGDLAGCLETLDRILAEDPTHLPALLTRAKIDAQGGRLDAAEERYRAVLRASPVNDEALQGLRDVAVRRGLAEAPGAAGAGGGGAAAAETERLLAAVAARAAGHLEKGELFAARDVYVELLSRARAASARAHQVTALRELARVADALGRTKDAEGFLGEALEVDPADPAALRELGDLHLRRLEDREGARRFYERYLAALPAGEKGDPRVLFNLANIVARSDPALAIEHARRAKEGGLDTALVERTLGYLHADVGAWRESLEAFTRYLETPPSGDEAERAAARRFIDEKVLPRLLERP